MWKLLKDGCMICCRFDSGEKYFCHHQVVTPCGQNVAFRNFVLHWCHSYRNTLLWSRQCKICYLPHQLACYKDRMRRKESKVKGRQRLFIDCSFHNLKVGSERTMATVDETPRGAVSGRQKMDERNWWTWGSVEVAHNKCFRIGNDKRTVGECLLWNRHEFTLFSFLPKKTPQKSVLFVVKHHSHMITLSSSLRNAACNCKAMIKWDYHDYEG